MSYQYKRISVRGVIRRQDKVLVEWFAPKSIGFLPGGSIEGNESLLATLERELSEELSGADYKIGKYLGKIAHFWKTEKGEDNCLNHYFEVILKSDSEIVSAEAGRQVKWLSLNKDESKSIKPPSLPHLLLVNKFAEWDEVDRE